VNDKPRRRLPVWGRLTAIVLLMLICLLAYRTLISMGTAGQISF
jgi:hypothetical protein